MKGMESFWSRHERVWATDLKGDTQVLIDRKEKVHWFPYQAPRDILALLLNLPKTFQVLLKERPEVVISTGASIAINFAIATKLLGIRFLFVESISRSEELSLSGKVIYPIADEFYVQWNSLAQKYPKAVFKGTVA